LAPRISRPNALSAVIGGSIMRFLVAFIAASAFAISPAMADDGGFYVGAGVGQASVEVDIDEGISDFDGSDTGFKVLGGYKFGKYVGLELEYIDGGEADDSWRSEDVTVSRASTSFSEEVRVEIGFTGWNASVLGAFPIGERFDVFAKIGAIMWDADFAADYLVDGSVVDSESASDDGTDFSWGVGGSWYFLENFGARIEYQDFDIEDADATLISASVLWLF
jgi:opacity protein-like surface antigen